MDKASVKALSSIPPYEVLVARLAGALNAPVTGLARSMSEVVCGLARSLSAVADKK